MPMKVSKRTNPMKYFEQVYLGKNQQENISAFESKRLQKLLTVKALTSSMDSRGITSRDLKRMMPEKIVLTAQQETDFQSILNPFDLA
jgi:hypothetical protein